MHLKMNDVPEWLEKLTVLTTYRTQVQTPIKIWILVGNSDMKERSAHVNIVPEALQREYCRLPTHITICDMGLDA